jgi:hypothetical protein
MMRLAFLQPKRTALKARNVRTAWRKNIKTEASAHGAACESLWDELERQVELSHGTVSAILHPSLKYNRMIASMRTEIVTVAPFATESAMNELERGHILMMRTVSPHSFK